MKVAILYKKEDIELLKKSMYIKKELKNKGFLYVKVLSIKSNLDNLNGFFDVFILITNNVEEILLLKNNVQISKKTLIITKNISTAFVINSVNITKNLLYLNVDFNTILKKIYNIYFDNLD